MWFFDCFLFWLFWDLLGWFGSPIESSFQNCGWTVKRAQPRCGCYGKQLGSGCRRDQRRVYRPRALSALLESITAHRRANARRKSSDVRRWEGKVQGTGDKRSSPSKFIPWLSIKKKWVGSMETERKSERGKRERESMRERGAQKENDRIRYIRHRKCSSHSKVPKVDRKRAFAK